MKEVNLHIGDTIKNYKALCEILQQPVKAGKSRTLQLKDFKRYFDWEKSGQKFIITDVYDTPLPKDDKRKLGNNRGHYTNGNSTYKVDSIYNQRCGVYKIQLDNDIYIGSTNNGFRIRYIQHYENSGSGMPHTQNLLLNGGDFSILWLAPICESEKRIRDMEQYYIDKYSNDKKYNLINKKQVTKNKANVRKYITVNNNDYNFVIKLLKKNRINVYN